MNYPRFLLATFFLFIILSCDQNQASYEFARHYSVDGLEDVTLKSNITRQYSWQDINSQKVIGQRGDKYIVDDGPIKETCSLITTINTTRLKEVAALFGIPETMMRYSYTSEQDRYHKIEQMKSSIAKHGFTYSVDNNSMNPNYQWIVRNSIRDMKNTALGLTKEAKRIGYTDIRQFYGVAASFVQSLEYRITPTYRRTRDGRKILIGGVTMPMETLYWGCGDCDTKSVLFASIMKNFKDTRVIFLAGNNHMYAAVRMAPRIYDSFITIKGEKYVLVELTQPWHIGHVPQQNLHALRLKKQEVIHLD